MTSVVGFLKDRFLTGNAPFLIRAGAATQDGPQLPPMMSRAFLSLVAAAVLSLGAGCAASDVSNEETEESADELNGGLRHITILKGTMNETGSITVAYEPHAYAPTRHIPFLAVELTDAEDAPAATSDAVRPQNGRIGGPLAVSVAGDFPGAPRVLVTDENFRVLAAGRGVATETGAQASVVVPSHTGKKLVLVRDMLWVKPMTFEVNVGRLQ